MTTSKMRLNPNKTVVLLMGPQPTLGEVLFPMLEGISLPVKLQICNLGILLDPTVLLYLQVNLMCRGAFSQDW